MKIRFMLEINTLTIWELQVPPFRPCAPKARLETLGWRGDPWHGWWGSSGQWLPHISNPEQPRDSSKQEFQCHRSNQEMSEKHLAILKNWKMWFINWNHKYLFVFWLTYIVKWGGQYWPPRWSQRCRWGTCRGWGLTNEKRVLNRTTNQKPSLTWEMGRQGHQ